LNTKKKEAENNEQPENAPGSLQAANKNKLLVKKRIAAKRKVV
jgi:hypothetical protein